jgi:hypothetical protein
MADPRISRSVKGIQERIETATVSAALSDGERVKDILRDLTRTALPTDMARLRACELLGRTVGLFKDVQETIDTRSADDVRQALEARLDAFAATNKDDESSTDKDDIPSHDSPAAKDNVPDCNGDDDGDSPVRVSVH